ncbi:MAG TPA: GTPase HflX [Rhizomicrobium sp.]|nr:GTPase HflX [Rhizomicrobium sp.]
MDSGALRARANRAFVIHVEPKNRSRPDVALRDAEARLAEAVGLTAAIHLDVVVAEIAPLARPVPATLLGSGKVEEIAHLAKAEEPEVIIVNAHLTPVQQRNLERAWNSKVLDRTAVILEIFGERAATREGRLQVELAHLNYQRSRLVRSWTHLERQRGGFGFLGGPGESQIETDRRLIAERIVRIKTELEKVKRTRSLGRRARKKVPFPVVALVGYTNAGKSTLFNRLTESEVLAKDLLFATLDPTMRGVKLPHGTKIILSDTVGFIADLPTELVAAFRATLEEVLEADVIVHVRDCAHDESAAQKADVLKVLEELGVETDSSHGRPMLEVLNKIDLLEPEQRAGLLARNARGGAVAVSAVTGEGIPALLAGFESAVTRDNITLSLKLEASDGGALAFAYRHAQVLERRDRGGKISLSLRIHPDDLGRFENRFPKKIVIEQGAVA